MCAMVSPTGKGIRKPFNWGRVIRHELVHILDLEQTNFQVPHWLTEGLAGRKVAGKATGKAREKPLTLARLQAAVEKSRDDAHLSARLAEQYWRRRRAKDARELVDKVLQDHPKHGLALFVKAQLLLAAGED